MEVKVATLETELKFKINPKKKGREFTDIVSRNLGIHETWFFGINFKDADNEDVWIDNSKKVSESESSQRVCNIFCLYSH